VEGHPRGEVLTVCLQNCDDVKILAGGQSGSVGRLNIIARKIQGDVRLRRASQLADSVQLHVQNLEGDIHCPRKSLSGQGDYGKPTSDWLKMSVGEFNEHQDLELEAAEAQMEKLGRGGAPPSIRDEEVMGSDTVAVDATNDPKVYIRDVHANVKILPRYDGEKIPELNIIVLGAVNEVEFQ
jgi:hypothetical protein